MTKLVTCFVIVCIVLVSFQWAEAQQQGKVYRIGYLKNGGIGSHEKAFREALRDLGYVDGRDIIIEWRPAEGKLDRLPGLAADLVRLKVDVIVALGVSPTRAAKQATSTIPIVMADSDDDPVRQGLIASLARPGGNITGVTSISSDLAGKRLELLRNAIPKLSRVTVLSTSKRQGSAAAGHVRETEIAARAAGMELRSVEISRAGDAEGEFRAAAKESAEAFLVVSIGGMGRYRRQILDLAVETRVPVMYTQSRWTRAGGLMSYSADTHELKRRAAVYVEKILKGANPAELPVEQPAKFEFLVNLKTAKQIGLTISPEVLYQATEVIK